jgi:hypothetical protein
VELPSWVKTRVDAESTAEIAILLCGRAKAITADTVAYIAGAGGDFVNRFHDRDWDDGKYIVSVHRHTEKYLESHPVPCFKGAPEGIPEVYYGYATHRDDLPEWAVPGDGYVVAELGLLVAARIDPNCVTDSREPIRYIVDMAEAFYRAHPTADWGEEYTDVLDAHLAAYVRANPKPWLLP